MRPYQGSRNDTRRIRTALLDWQYRDRDNYLFRGPRTRHDADAYFTYDQLVQWCPAPPGLSPIYAKWVYDAALCLCTPLEHVREQLQQVFAEQLEDEAFGTDRSAAPFAVSRLPSEALSSEPGMSILFAG